MNAVTRFLSNDSTFGRLMTKIGIIAAVNLLFLLGCLGIVTAGASLCALYYTEMRYLRGERELNPFRVFWKGFKENFVKATAVWCGAAVLLTFLALEMFWCSQSQGVMHLFVYALSVLVAVVTVVAFYAFPGIAAFEATLRQHLLNSMFFAGKSPIKILLVTAAAALPAYLTWLLPEFLPLSAFLWCSVGFAAVGFVQSRLFLELYAPYLAMEKNCER